MAQANVAREPSMEEILASIRKIIETGDDEDAAAATPAAQPETTIDDRRNEGQSPTVMQAANEQTVSEAPMIPDRDIRPEAVRPKTRPPARPAAGPVAMPPDTQDMDVGAAARAAAEANKQPVSLAEVAAEAESTTKSDIEEAIRQQIQGSSAAQSNSDRSSEGPSAPQAASLRGSADRDEESNVHRSSDPMMAQADSGISDREETRALISPAAGAKVAASFDNLSHALVKGPDRSFDEIAEDMLRPMLQQWLDDNLPTLVERLVREEIERVARG
ncbi:MAG: DUF2497 domain-containing protein [Hyphomicrobiales bacterium]|nr:DUF2497 domain-containing protein [Hyphomicrobiales bacterium]MCP5002116.1 DUF2497 domain-containing protein [Hyphomicrobiales bacterium]